MVKKTKEWFEKIPSYLKYLASVLSIVVTLAGAIYAMEDRYIDQKEVSHSLEMFNVKMKNDIDKIELQMLNNQLESTTSEYYKHKQLIRAYPEDEELKEEFEILKEKRETIKSRINEKTEIK